MTPRVAVAPSPSELVRAAVVDGGGVVVNVSDDPDALVWLQPGDVRGLLDAVRAAPSAGWVQLPFAGVEEFVDALDPARTWTCAKGVYAMSPSAWLVNAPAGDTSTQARW